MRGDLFHPPVVVVCVVLRDRDGDGRVLVARRRAGLSNAGCWEFPGGKVAPGESHADALVRELREELGVVVRVGDFVGSAIHEYSGDSGVRAIELFGYWGELASGDFVLSDHDEVKWVFPGDIVAGELSAADRFLVDLLGA